MLTRIVLAAVLSAVALPARADPCTAIPDRGPMPSYLHKGAVFSGPVAYIGDGDSLCVDVASSLHFLQRAPRGSAWVEVRLADFYAPEIHEPAGPAAKAALERLTAGQVVRCVADHRSYDRMVARCKLGGVSLGDRLRAAGVPEGGRGWR